MKWSSWVSVWLASGLLLLQTGIVYSNTCISSNPLKELHGKALQGFRIWALQVRDIMQCARACVQQTICRSFNFETTSNFCELSNKIMEEKPEFMVDNAGMIYSDISKWESEIFPECFNKPCPENAVCLPKTLAELGCEFGCLEIPISCPGGETYGKKISHLCPKGQRGSGFSVCQADSTWSAVDFSGCEMIFNNSCNQSGCDVINGSCSRQLGTCQCETGSIYNAEKATCDFGVFGGPCSSPEHCKSINGSCTSSKCECPVKTVYSKEDRLCVTDCGDPQILGLNISAGGTRGTSIRYVMCADGFQAAGVDNDTIVCQPEDGVWSKPQTIDCRGFRFANTTGAFGAAEGQLQMFYKNKWRYVHKDKWKPKWTRAACESMGFKHGGSWQTITVVGGSELYKLDDKCDNPINCSQKYIDLDKNQAIGITCFNETLNSSNVRLSNNGNIAGKEGYVELFYCNEWGTVCNNNTWGNNEANVLCKMMGLNKDKPTKDYGKANSTVKVWTSGVKCRGDEESIFECENLGWNKTFASCVHHTDDSKAKCN